LFYLIGFIVFIFIIALLTGLILLTSWFLTPKGPFSLVINKNDPLDIDPGDTILTSLYEHKIFIPSACGGQGTCGFCKVKIVEGDGDLLPTEQEFLSSKEKKDGVRLACQHKVRNSLKLEIPEDLLNAEEYEARVISTKTLTEDIKEISFDILKKTMEFKCGQYIQIKVPSSENLQGFEFRAYSVASSEAENQNITLNIKLIPDGLGSTYLHNLKTEDKVSFTGPYGEWKINETPEESLILVAGGVGMAPVRSILHSVCKNYPDKIVHLFFGARSKNDLFYVEEFRQLVWEKPNINLHYALSEPEKNDKWDGETGFIHLTIDKIIKSDNHRQDAFLCGPPLMIEAVMKILAKKKINTENIFYDKF
jgi:Na+-transporting NADH:ubiquinone oxidoreductase subunit F